ncbi:hypothetical protein M8J75_013557 [Diaphorina citri]|nr:hypothetical protein M8J75_013557 [Diaphorina citri]
MENDCWPTPGSDQQLHQHQSAPYNTLNSCAGPDNVSQLDDLRYSNMDHGSAHLLVPGSSASPPGANGGGSTASSGVSTGAVSPSGSLTNNSSCCENGRPIMTDPVSGQTVCSCQYDSARLALSSYPRLSTGAGVYGTPYPSTDQNPYPSIDSTAFYSPLVSG